jgi:hypothetical protein
MMGELHQVAGGYLSPRRPMTAPSLTFVDFHHWRAKEEGFPLLGRS